MKKTTLFIMALLSGMAFADMPNRFFELGFDLGAGASNNYLSVSDIFTETLVIDLDDIARDIGQGGFCLDAGAGFDFVINVNATKKLSVGIFADSSVNAFTSLPDSLFDLLAEGNTPDQEYAGELGLRGSAFASIGADASYKMGKWKFGLRPSYFMPILHIGESTAAYSLLTGSDSTITASGQAAIPVYTPVAIESLESDFDVGSAINTLFSSGGVDFLISGSYALFPFLDLGAKIEGLPLFRARMDQRSMLNASFSAEVTNLLDSLMTTTEGEDFYTMEYAYEFVSDVAPIKVSRPFKLGVSALYKPFSFLRVEPNLALAFSQGAYLDIGVRAEVAALNLVALGLSTQYLDRLWRNSLDLRLNLWLLELDFLVSTRSADFDKSFGLSGLTAGMGLRIGL